jgi:hypothetical protein
MLNSFTPAHYGDWEVRLCSRIMRDCEQWVLSRLLGGQVSNETLKNGRLYRPCNCSQDPCSFAQGAPTEMVVLCNEGYEHRVRTLLRPYSPFPVPLLCGCILITRRHSTCPNDPPLSLWKCVCLCVCVCVCVCGCVCMCVCLCGGSYLWTLLLGRRARLGYP